MADVNQTIIEEGIKHWPIYVGVAIMFYGMWKWIIPNSVKSSMENGGGDAIRRVVSSELQKQDDRIDEKLKDQDERFDQKLSDYAAEDKQRMIDALVRHEEIERVTLQNVVIKLKTEVENKIDSIIEAPIKNKKKLKVKK